MRFCIAAALAAVFIAAPSFAKFKDITPVADANVSESAPNDNYGSSTSLWVESATASDLNKRAWLKFEIEGKIPENATISSAKLRLYLFSAEEDGYPMDIEVYGSSNDDWYEDTITWGNQPAILATDPIFDTTPGAGNAASSVTLQSNREYLWYELDVTDFVISKINGNSGSDGTATLMVKPVNENENNWRLYRFNSREYNTNLTPKLRIEYTGNWDNSSSVNIIHFNDIHSRLTTHDLDFPDADGEAPAFEEAGGIAYLTTQVVDLKTNRPNSLVLDAGDISEGNPLGDLRGNGGMIDFLEDLDTQLSNIPSNTAGRGIDAIVVGNHDVRALSMVNNMKNSPLPFISVNILDDGAAIPSPSSSPAGMPFAPYVMIETDHDDNTATPDVNVAVIGYSTDDSTHLTDETVNVLDVIEVRWADSDASTIDLRDWVEFVRSNENADIVVLLSHVGHRRLNSTDQILLGDLGKIAPPDVVISGHWHTWTETAWQPSNLNYNTTNVEAASYAQYVGELQLTPNGRYLGAQKHPIRVSDITPNSNMLNLISTLTAEYNALPNRPCVLPPSVTGNSSAAQPCPLHHVVGHSATDLSLDKDKWFTLSEFPWSGDNTAGEWISDAMVWKVNDGGGAADLALQSGGGVRRDVAAGPVTFLEIYETYPWSDDNMVHVQMSSQDVWNYLESHFVGSAISKGWQVTADDGVITAISYDQDGPGSNPATALSKADTTTLWDVVISEYMYEHDDWISESGSDFSFSDLSTTVTPLGLSIRDSVIEYTAQFGVNNPMTVVGPRYVLNTELAGGFRAVVTMANDAENEPYFEAVFVRLLNATPETTARRNSYGLSELVNADGSINTEHQFAETMLYRSHLGFPDGYLKPGDIIEIWGEGGFFDGNPQLVDQQGILDAELEFKLLGADVNQAQPDFKQNIAAFWDEHHENHYVSFYAERISDNSVRDSNGAEITIYKEGGYFSMDMLPGTNGEVLKLTGVQTERASRTPSRRFRLHQANVVTGYPPASNLVDNLPANLTAGQTITLSAMASDVNGTGLISGKCQENGNTIAFTSFEEPTAVPGVKYTDANTASHSLSNNAGQPPVVYTSAGAELGFSAQFTSTGSAAGLSDGDYMGVQDYTGDVSAFSDGTQGYQLSDADGIVTVSLDTVNLQSLSNASVCVDLFVKADNWETSDRIRIWADTGSEIELLNTAGSDIDDLQINSSAIEGAWHTITADLSGASIATLNFELESNAANEAIYIDNITFQDAAAVGTTPQPVTGTVSDVQFFYSSDGGHNFHPAGTDTDGSDGWSLDFTLPAAGDYLFYSIATDSEGFIEPAPQYIDLQATVSNSNSGNSEQVPLPLWSLLLLASALAYTGLRLRRLGRGC